jgi:protein-S-isoprenylcysteine O-methyltransferase Ste14
MWKCSEEWRSTLVGLSGTGTDVILTDVLDLAGRFIAVCWVVFVVVWFIAAWFAKRTVERSGTWAWWIVWIVAILLPATPSRWMARATGVSLWRATPCLAVVAAAVTVAGLSVALWARAALGRNWSSAVVLKEQHDLIDRGPYAFVRHPIYTGVLLMVLGTVTVSGTTAAVIVFATMVAGLMVKARREERLLTTHFPELYPRYRARVPARLIPFLL